MSLHRFLERIGAPVERIARQAGLSTAGSGDPDAFVPCCPVYRYYGAAARARGIENLGAQVGLSTSLWDLGSYGRALGRSDTLHGLMLSAVLLGRRFSSDYRYRLCEDGPRVWFCRRLLGRAHEGSDQVDAFGIAQVIHAVREIVGPDWCPERILVPARNNGAMRGVGAWAGTRIELTRDVSAVPIPREFLPLGLQTTRTRPPANGNADPELLAPPSDFVESITLVIRCMSGNGLASLRGVAQAAGMSARSLQRHLADSGVTFSGLLGRTLFSRAAELLQDPAVKTIDVAFELGYSDPANFTRAFRRWTGGSPRAYRGSSPGLRA